MSMWLAQSNLTVLILVVAVAGAASGASCTYRTGLDEVRGHGGALGGGGNFGTGGSDATGGVTTAGGTPPSPAPCDAFAAGNTPCVAAHSTVRALYGAYAGNLYQVQRADGATKDIGVLAPGGVAKAADQDSFCGTAACTISVLYDQSGNGNHLVCGTSNTLRAGRKPADAKALPITLGGHKVYGVHLPAGVGYAYVPNHPGKLAMGDAPETIYMVASGDYYNAGCCFDYGNVETSITNTNKGATEAVFFGSYTDTGRGGGSGPWVMGDLGAGVWPGNARTYAGNTSVSYKFVTAMVKGDSGNHWAIKAGDAQAGGLSTMFDGPRPPILPTQFGKEGAIALNLVGDPNNSSQGNFFEGVLTAGYSTSATDEAVQASIVAAGYGR
jgi:hypothetical protein